MKYYVEGDRIQFDYCGEDLSASTTGVVVFVDKEHVIVRFEFCNPFAASGLNRKGLSEEELTSLHVDIESLRKNEYDVFVDLKAPHSYLPNDIFNDEKAAIRPEDIYWCNVVLDEPINGYSVVEKDGKYNFIDLNTDNYISDLWFDRVINWVYRKEIVHTREMNFRGSNGVTKHIPPHDKTIEGIYTIVQIGDTCYKIQDQKDFYEERYLFVTNLTPEPVKSKHTHPKRLNLSPRRRSDDFKDIFGAREYMIKDLVYKTVCKIDNRWYLAYSLKQPWARKWRDIYYQRDKEATVKMDRQWWYFMFTTMACSELCIGQSNGKYGFFPLMAHMGMQDGDYYAEGYPFIYDEYKIYESDTVHQHYHIDNAYSYIAVRENEKWGLLKITGMPSMKIEQVSESKYPDPETMFYELGIEIPNNPEEPDLREETGEW